MEITFQKELNRAHVFRIRRQDGSETWQRHTDFFVLHDLLHYVVEKNLRYKEAFYGLVEQGKNIEDFDNLSREASRSLPWESIVTEHLVNLFASELTSEQPWQDFLDQVETVCRQAGLEVPQIADSQLRAIREQFKGLHQQWQSLKDSERLTLHWP
ncbi:MAG: hypothetical protein AAFR61_30120 [Bacteroidota bacterium]